MADKRPPPRHPWANRFERPTPQQLLTACGSKSLAQLAATARAELSRLETVSEDLTWNGLPWRWTLVYTQPGGHPAPLAYLIPEPQRPQIAVPLAAAMIATLPLARMKRFVRDGIAQGRLVGDIRWACWEFSARTHLDEILDLVKRKHRLATPALTPPPPPPKPAPRLRAAATPARRR